MSTISLQKANEMLANFRHGKWYFEKRNDKIWLVEELSRTFNRVFYCFNPDGTTSRDLLDMHLRRALSFIRRKRQEENRDVWDVRGKVFSGLTADDKEGKDRSQDEQKALDSALRGH